MNPPERGCSFKSGLNGTFDETRAWRWPDRVCVCGSKLSKIDRSACRLICDGTLLDYVLGDRRLCCRTNGDANCDRKVCRIDRLDRTDRTQLLCKNDQLDDYERCDFIDQNRYQSWFPECLCRNGGRKRDDDGRCDCPTPYSGWLCEKNGDVNNLKIFRLTRSSGSSNSGGKGLKLAIPLGVTAGTIAIIFIYVCCHVFVRNLIRRSSYQTNVESYYSRTDTCPTIDFTSSLTAYNVQHHQPELNLHHSSISADQPESTDRSESTMPLQSGIHSFSYDDSPRLIVEEETDNPPSYEEATRISR